MSGKLPLGILAATLLGGCAICQDLSWLKFGGSYRARGEIGHTESYDSDATDNFYLGRFRVHADATPMPGLEMFVEAQDGRTAGLQDPDGDGMLNQFDLRQGWVQLGAETSRWSLKAGRQELAFGDERLIGADSEWDPIGFTWNAALASFKTEGFNFRSFAAWKVLTAPRGFDGLDPNERLYGIVVTFPQWKKRINFEPYLFLNEQLRHCFENNLVTNRIGALGVRATGEITRQIEFNSEMVTERGRFNNLPMRSWAGHWEIGLRLGYDDTSARLVTEYNFATGDKGNDRVRSTFNDLYPAGYNAFGMADPFAWRNISNPAVRVEKPLPGKWRILGGWRWYALDSVQDALYIVGEEYLVRNPGAPSATVGQQLNLAVAWHRLEHWDFRAGYSRLFPGAYLQQSGFHNALSTPFASLTFSF